MPIALDIGLLSGLSACAATPANSARAWCAHSRASTPAGIPPRQGAKAGHQDRVIRHPKDRLHEVFGNRVEAVSQRSEHTLPAPAVSAQIGGGARHRPLSRRAPAAVERVGVLHLWPPPAQSVGAEVKLPRERGVERQRVRGRALVVNQARERQLARASAAAEGVGRLEDGHLQAGVGEGRAAASPLGPLPTTIAVVMTTFLSFSSMIMLPRRTGHRQARGCRI